jgi:hypothetical protein
VAIVSQSGSSKTIAELTSVPIIRRSSPSAPCRRGPAARAARASSRIARRLEDALIRLAPRHILEAVKNIVTFEVSFVGDVILARKNSPASGPINSTISFLDQT